MARLASHIWVSAYLMRLSGAGIYAHIVAKGDETAGAITIKVATMNGKASLITRGPQPDGRVGWHVLMQDAAEDDVDQRIGRQRRIDPDLWVVEVEDPRGRHLLDGFELGE